MLVDNPEFSETICNAVDRPAPELAIGDFLDRLVAPPEPSNWVYQKVRDAFSPSQNPPRVDYLEREARNASLGLAGERFVVEFERARLSHQGRVDLVKRVEHVSVTMGDGLGFDVRSFDENGSERLIEVKTTAGGKQTPFFLSRNELEVSRVTEEKYHLYRVFSFRRDPHLFSVRGALDSVCKLEAVNFSARIG